MKNINVDNIAIMTGANWVATPFCLNYGYYEHGYEDDYLEYEYERGEIETTNYFGMEKKEYVSLIREYITPKSYSKSFYLGDIAYAMIGAPNKQFNTIQLLFDEGSLRIACCWLDYNRKSDIGSPMEGFNLKPEDYNLLADIKLIDYKPSSRKIITLCVMHFKYSAELYKRDFHIRFGKDFVNSELQYSGFIRMDSGRDEDSNKYETFSIVNSFEIPQEVANECANIIEILNFEEVDYE